MRYMIEARVNADPNAVFAAIHQYKVSRRPGDLFGDALPPKTVKIDFAVLSDNTLGLGAVYGWEFRISGLITMNLQFC